MTTPNQKLWPYQPKFTIIIAVTLVIFLILITGLLRTFTGWPFIFLTQDKKYLGLVSRQTLYNEALKNIFNNNSKTSR